MTARGDVASSQAPPWPKNRLRIRPTDVRLCGGLSARKRASDSLKPSVGHLATKARFAPIGDRAGIGRGKQGIENCEQRVVGRRAYNRQRRAAPRQRSTALHPL